MPVNKIKVLYVHTLPLLTGSGLAVYLMMDGLDKSRYDVELACGSRGPLIETALEKGIQFNRIPHLVQPINIFKDLVALLELILLIKRKKYNIVHTHNSKAGILGRLAAKINRVPVIVHTIHGFAFHDFECKWRKKLFIFLEKFTAKFTDKLFVISKPLMEWGLAEGIGNAEKYIINYDGIEIEKFQNYVDVEAKKKEFGLSPDERVVGTVAKLWEGKGHKYLLEAASEIIKFYKDVKFMFVGEGYLDKELKDYAKKLNIADSIIFTGFKTDIPEITAIFDIACLPSLFEGMGRVLLEAQASGKPVVATRVGGIAEIVKDGQSGILVPPADSHALAEAIIKLLKERELLEKMGRAARERVGNEFSSKEMVRKVYMIYNEFTQRPGK